MTELEPCCICGKDWNAPNDLIDTVYPEMTKYFAEDGPVYSWLVVCQLHNTGCGRMVFGDSREEAISNWNSGLTDVIKRFKA